MTLGGAVREGACPGYLGPVAAAALRANHWEAYA